MRGILNKFPSNLFNTFKMLASTDLKDLTSLLINRCGIPRCEMNLPKANIILLLLISAVSSE